MRLLAVLQNQWFHDPEKVRAILARTPQARRRLIHYSLFAGCRTGRVLKDVFGEERCRTIVWEEASPEIGGKASSCFPADQAHLRAVLDDVKPDLVLAFGRIAGNALAELVPGAKLILGPHPTARQPDTMTKLRVMAGRIELFPGVDIDAVHTRRSGDHGG
jgi:hypothetical protein